MCTIFLNTPVFMLHHSFKHSHGREIKNKGSHPTASVEQLRRCLHGAAERGLLAEVPCLHRPPSLTVLLCPLQFQEDPALGSTGRKQFLNRLGRLNSLFSWLFICGDLGEHVLYSSKHKNLRLYVRYAYVHVCFMYVYMFACVYRHTWRSIGMNICM